MHFLVYTGPYSCLVRDKSNHTKRYLKQVPDLNYIW